jgi:hypothetical protein
MVVDYLLNFTTQRNSQIQTIINTQVGENLNLFLVLKHVFYGVATLIQRIKVIILETTRVNEAWEHNAKCL